MKKFKFRNYINYTVIAILGIVFTVLTFSSGLDQSTLYMLEKMCISIVLAVSLSLVVGFLGELSLGHAGFMCIGAYLGGKFSCIIQQKLGTQAAVSPWCVILCLLIGGIVAAVFGLIIGLPALRLKGDYLAIVTLAFGEIVRSIFMNSGRESFGGALGLDTPRYSKDTFFIYGFICVLITLAVVQNMLKSRHGRAITAIRDSEIAARAMGIDVTKYKLLTFTVSSFFAGIAGVLYSFSNYTIQSTKFSYNYSIEILVMVVLGGMGSINGSIIAAALITFLNLKLATILTGNLAVLQNLVYALILILIVIYNNAPGLKGFRERHNFKNAWARLVHAKFNPDKEKGDEGKWERIPTKIEMDELLSVDVTEQHTEDGDGKEEQ